MTHKEAIDWCEQFRDNIVMTGVEKEKYTLALKAMRTAIKALEKQIPKDLFLGEVCVLNKRRSRSSFTTTAKGGLIMGKCKYETKSGRCSLKDSYAYRHKCYTEENCKCHEHIEPCERHEPMTNADRIRAMSDEELAEYFAEIGNDTSNGIAYSESPEEWLKWLQQPAETEPATNVDTCVCCGAIIPEGQMVCPNCLVVVKEG